jgi:hypothetical protein
MEMRLGRVREMRIRRRQMLLRKKNADGLREKEEEMGDDEVEKQDGVGASGLWVWSGSEEVSWIKRLGVKKREFGWFDENIWCEFVVFDAKIWEYGLQESLSTLYELNLLMNIIDTRDGKLP